MQWLGRVVDVAFSPGRGGENCALAMVVARAGFRHFGLVMLLGWVGLVLGKEQEGKELEDLWDGGDLFLKTRLAIC